MSTRVKAYAAPAKGRPLERLNTMPARSGTSRWKSTSTIAASAIPTCRCSTTNGSNRPTSPVADHEVVGTVVAAGPAVKRVKVGDRVGLGWIAGSCMVCPQCLSGDHNLCSGSEQTIVKRHGGFAQRVQADWAWAIPLPGEIDPGKARYRIALENDIS